MSDSFKIDTFPSTFKWLESSISALDQDESEHSNILCVSVYALTIGCTSITILADIFFGFVEATFYVLAHQDFSRALSTLKRKWVEAVFQEMAFVVIGVGSMITELGDWKQSYRVTKCFVQTLSECFLLGTPQIFNCIRYPIPQDGLAMPSSCSTRKDVLLFDVFNTKRSKFYANLKEFQRKHKASNLDRFYGANHHLQRILKAKTPSEVMALNVDSLKGSDVSKRLEDSRNVFSNHFQDRALMDILQVIISAHDLLLSYLDLPFHIRREIAHP